MWYKLLLAQMLLNRVFLVLKGYGWYVITQCLFLTSVYLEAPVSEGRETVAAIERPVDTTGSDEVDVSTERTVAALPEFTNEACKAAAAGPKRGAAAVVHSWIWRFR